MDLAALLLPTVVVVPLLGATLAFVLPARLGVLVVATALAFTAAEEVLLVVHVLDGGALRHVVGGWPVPLGIPLEVGGMSALVLVTNVIVMAWASVYASSYLRRIEQPPPQALRHFWPLWLLLFAGLNGVAVSADLFNLYVMLEVMSISAAALVALSGAKALVAGLRYLLVGIVGSSLYLLGVALIYGQYGVVDMGTVARLATATPATALAIAVMTAGLLLKTAVWPLHFWLPPAHGGALTPISAVLSGLVVKASFFLLVRLLVGTFAAVGIAAGLELLGALGAVAIVWGSLQAIRQRSLKRLVAYSTVAQLGYLLLALPLTRTASVAAIAIEGALLFLLSHALAKAAAFLAAGNFQHAFGDDSLDSVACRGMSLPVTTFAYALAGVALVGLPPSGTFVAKWLLLRAALEQGRFDLAIVTLLGSLLAAAYVFPVLASALCRFDLAAPPPERVPTATMQWSALTLALLACVLGAFAAWPSSLLRAELAPVPPVEASP